MDAGNFILGGIRKAVKLGAGQSKKAAAGTREVKT
jgi:hypothetical protein